jgi:hypothetical protein
VRYYRIVVRSAKSGEVLREWSSLDKNGNIIPGALNVELDAPVVVMAIPMGAAYVRLWGISLQDIGQAMDLNGQTIEVYAGMSKGLPLANPKQAGLILQGTIQQAFGNWQDTNMTLDFVINPASGTLDAPANLVLTWRKGQKLSDAIKATLALAYPTYTASINISDKLVLAQDETGYYQTLVQFAAYVKRVSQSIVGNGVDISVKDEAFTVTDGSVVTTPKTIAFTDLIGQPTWTGLKTIQFKTVLRADISPQDFIQMPKAQTTQSQQSYSQYRQSSTFQGTFQVQSVRHVGNFRQPDANAWATNIEAFTT